MDAINLSSVFFLLFATLASLLSFAVLFTKNVVRMAFYLVLALSATAGLFFLAGADFVGAMQLMIYVGGTLVLLVFGVMLTSQSSFVSMKAGGFDWVLAAVVGAPFLGLLISSALNVDDWKQGNPQEVAIADQVTTTRLAMGLLGARVDQPEQANADLRSGMSGYLLPFEIVSVHLLVVLVGASYLARGKRRADVASYEAD